MKFLPVLLILFVFSCSNIDDISLLPTDLTPPKLLSFKVVDSRTLSISSNEEITLIEKSYYSRENVELDSFSTTDKTIEIELKESMIPGKEYCSEYKIEDDNGNSLFFIAKYYGYNPNKPEILINEFIVKGTKTNPDKIELYIKSSGNMAGLTLFNGSKNNYDYSFIFPSIDVLEGEYIVVRSTSDDFNSVCIEIDNLNIDNDKKFLNGIRDLRIDNFKLSGTNGVISLYEEPYGKIMDSVIYSKNHNDDSKNYRNFGLSTTMKRIDDIGEEEGWVSAGDLIYPDDAIFVDDSTTTRSLNRVNFTDSDSNNDWRTVSTGEASFGYANSTNYY